MTAYEDCVHPYHAVHEKLLKLYVADRIENSSGTGTGQQVGANMPVIFCDECNTVIDAPDIRVRGVVGLSTGRYEE